MISEYVDSDMAMDMKLKQSSVFTILKVVIKAHRLAIVERNHYYCDPSPLEKIIMKQAAPIVKLDLEPQ